VLSGDAGQSSHSGAEDTEGVVTVSVGNVHAVCRADNSSAAGV